MAEFTLIISDNDEAELVVTHEDQKFESLLSDELVMDWLHHLEAGDSSSEEAQVLRACL